MATQTSTSNTGAHETSGQDETPHYLSAFQQLGSQAYFYHPLHGKHATNGTSGTNGTTEAFAVPRPDLIIICSWMAASSRHIAKYTNPYLARYKSIPMLLIRSSQTDVLFKPEQDYLEEIKPAITAIQSVFGSVEAVPRVLMHIFSNGGSWSAHVLSEAYQRATGGLTLPISALVLDSCPSIPDIKLSHLALSAALPKNFIIHFVGSIFLWIMLFLTRTFNKLRITENLVLKVRQVLNDPLGPFIKGGVPRVYICSKTDVMVPLEDVKRHAEDAEAVMRRTGLNEDEARKRVVFEEFYGSPHVGHLMKDADRYWQIVRTVWIEAMKIKEREALDLQRARTEREERMANSGR